MILLNPLIDLMSACAFCLSRRCGRFLVATLASLAATSATAHPHVFVDGQLDVVVSAGERFEAVSVTLHYGPFETLYLLSENGITLDPDQGLSAAHQEALVRQLGVWPDEFEGFAHLSLAGERQRLGRPEALVVFLEDGNLRLRYRRRLEEPAAMAGRAAEIAFYEATYFYELRMVNEAEIIGAAGTCAAETVPFSPSNELLALQTSLFDIPPDETPDIDHVGAFFADRVRLSCE
ncbi:MAG: DUF1007 family protein [Pseudomonadota bacterium]